MDPLLAGLLVRPDVLELRVVHPPMYCSLCSGVFEELLFELLDGPPRLSGVPDVNAARRDN